MTETIFDPLRVVAGLRAHGTRFVLVGDLAAMAHGSAVTPDRTEICVSDDDEDVDRLGLMLQALGAEQREAGDMHRAVFSTSAGRVECVALPREGRFAEIVARASEVSLGNGVIARVAALEDIAAMRVASDDLVGAVRAATLVAANADATVSRRDEDVDEFGPDRPRDAGVRSPWRRVGRVFEDVDRFLTDLNEGKLARRR